MSEIDLNKRYDCFISFHGSEPLSSLGFPFQTGHQTVRELVDRLRTLLRRREQRKASVFVDSAELSGRISDLFNAILQLRGGGVALVLITVDYLRSKYCLAELRALLELARLVDDPDRRSEAVVLRVFCLEPPGGGRSGVDVVLDVVRGMLRDSATRPFVDGLDKRVLLAIGHRLSPDTVAEKIANHVWRYWDGHPSRLALGGSRDESFLDMARFFSDRDRDLLGSALGTSVGDRDGVMDVINAAVQRALVSDSDVERLAAIVPECDNSSNVTAAVASYRRKWSSSDWSWSSQTAQELRGYVDEARIALRWHWGGISEALWSSVRQAVSVVQTALYGQNSGNNAQHDREARARQEANRYTVYISHAMEDLQTIAIPLYEELQARSIHTFLFEFDARVGEPIEVQLFRAMDKSRIAVLILSPEYVARRWPMKELRNFLRRWEQSGRTGHNCPVLIPVFYRYSVEDCMRPQLRRWRSVSGAPLLEEHGFFDQARQQEASTEDVEEMLKKLVDFFGVRTVSGAGSECGWEANSNEHDLRERRWQTIEDVVSAVQRHAADA